LAWTTSGRTAKFINIIILTLNTILLFILMCVIHTVHIFIQYVPTYISFEQNTMVVLRGKYLLI